MWYKPWIYTLDYTTCLLCRPPLPLLISEAVKNCQDISCWRKLGGGDVWFCHKSEMFATCGNARAHLFPNSCVAKTLKFNFQLFLYIFLMCSSSFKTISKVVFKKHIWFGVPIPCCFYFLLCLWWPLLAPVKNSLLHIKSKVVLTNVTENSCRKTKMSFTIYTWIINRLSISKLFIKLAGIRVGLMRT